MEPMSLKRRRIYFWILSVLFIVIIPPIILYTSGYRLGPGFTLVETGGMYIYSPEPGSVIYIDGKKRRETTLFSRDWFLQDVTPGTYTVLIAKDEFWPWIKEVEVTERHVVEAIAFLIPKNPDIEIIEKTIEVKVGTATSTRANPIYTETLALFTEEEAVPQPETAPKQTDTLATTTDTLTPIFIPEKISSHGRVGLTQEDNRILAYWTKSIDDLPNYFCRETSCVSPVIAFSSVVPIRSFDFYPGRDDVILIAVQDGIFAVEIDGRKIQNFQPIYRGQSPDFRLTSKGFVVKDGDTLARISF